MKNSDESVIYQGREIPATVLNYQSGSITLGRRRGNAEADGDEEILRDTEGHYYLRQRINWDGPVRVHRISVKAAILWATVRANWLRNDLREAARDLIAGREAA